METSINMMPLKELSMLLSIAAVANLIVGLATNNSGSLIGALLVALFALVVTIVRKQRA
jgi:ABC-type branched-subunit amino acid transport system permease subunit